MNVPFLTSGGGNGPSILVTDLTNCRIAAVETSFTASTADLAAPTANNGAFAVGLFGIVKGIKRDGLGNFRAQGQRECPHCKEFVAIDAIKCKWCTADIDPELLDEEDIPLLKARGWTPPEPDDA